MRQLGVRSVGQDEVMHAWRRMGAGTSSEAASGKGGWITRCRGGGEDISIDGGGTK